MKKIFLYFALLCMQLFFSGCPDDTLTPGPDSPYIDSLKPSQIILGNIFSIKGRNFDSLMNNSVVIINGKTVEPGNITFWSDTLIYVILPGWAQNGELYIKKNSETSNKVNLQIYNFPFISTITPDYGFQGDTLTIRGRFFGESAENSFVFFEVKHLNAVYWSDTLIKFIIPEDNNESDYDAQISVFVNNNHPSYIFKTILKNPKITSLSNGAAPVNSEVAVSGMNFKYTGENYDEEKTTLKLNGQKIESITEISARQIVFKVLQNAVSGMLTITRFGRESNSVYLKIIEQPVIASIEPELGNPGDIIKIKGSGFSSDYNNSFVSFEELKASEILSWKNDEIICKVPDINRCVYVRVNVEGVVSNEKLFKTPDCPTQTKYSFIKYVESYSSIGAQIYKDTLNHQPPRYFFKFRNPNYSYSDKNSCGVTFDENNMNLKEINITYNFIEANGGPRFYSYKETIVNITGKNIPLHTFTNTNLTYKISSAFADKLIISYTTTGTWRDEKYGTSGTYNDKGFSDPKNAPDFEFIFY